MSSHCNFTQFLRLVLLPVLDEFVLCHFFGNMTVPHASFLLAFLHTYRIFLSVAHTKQKFINIYNYTIYLQMAIKFTNEPPQGIRASLKRTYQNITQVCLFLTVFIPLGKGFFVTSFMKAVHK
jgi:Dynein heavy chain.